MFSPVHLFLLQFNCDSHSHSTNNGEMIARLQFTPIIKIWHRMNAYGVL